MLELHKQNTKLLEEHHEYFQLEEEQMMLKHDANTFVLNGLEDDEFYDAE